MEDTPDKKESQSESAEETYYKRIRTAFAKRRDEIKKSCYSIRIRFLVDYLKKYYQIVCDEKTVRQLFDSQCKTAIKPHLIVAMCNILGLDLYSVIQYPQCIDEDYCSQITLRDVFARTKVSADEPDLFESKDNAISYLSSEHYHGTYHCYYFIPKQITNSVSAGKNQPEVNDIRHAVLEIKQENGETRACLTEQNTASGKAFTFTGRVIRLENVSKIYLFLSAENGNGFMWLLFDDVVLRKRGLYYKEIAMMTHSVSSQSKPIFEKMVLLKQEIDPEDKDKEQIIRGILTFDNETILVPADRAEEIIQDEKEFAPIFDTEERYYRISKYDIIDNNRLKWDYNKRVEVLLRIMAQSFNHTQAVVDQEKQIHDFFFDFQGL